MLQHKVLNVPDLITQELANKISDEEVQALRFTGGEIHSDHDDGIIVTDRALINQFLEALRHASGRQDYGGNRMCYLFIETKHRTTSAEPIITLRFWPTNAADCFGPDFQEALRKLSDYYAAQVAREISEVKERITKIEIANHIEHIIHVIDPAETKALVQDLTQIDGKAFAFTEASDNSLSINGQASIGLHERCVAPHPLV
ncbi:MAG: hypothetical protein H0X25_22040 [Acidobacteriales bacterium]|nr:hypothetical protein [Terriglobales bacterium]